MPPETKDSTLAELARGLLEAFALISVLTFGLLHLSYSRFYATFGVSPEDVGANSTSVLAQSALGIAALILFFTSLPIAIVVILRRVTTNRLVVQSSVLVYVLILSLSMFFFEANDFSITNFAVTVVGVLIAGVASLFRPGLDPLRGLQLGLVASAVGLLGLFFISLLPKLAEDAAHCAVGGEFPGSVRGVDENFPLLGKVQLLGVRAEQAHVDWLGSGRSPLPDRPLVYLGSSGGRAVFFDPVQGAAIRVDDSAVAVTTVKNPLRAGESSYNPC